MQRRELCVASLGWCLAGGMSGAQAAGLADTVLKVKAAIVLVGTYKPTDNPRFQLRGTGFVVGTGQRVVTNAHVLPELTGLSDEPTLVVQVRGPDGQWQRRNAVRELRDDPRDLAILRMEGDPVPALQLGDSDRVREGDDLAFTGFPIGGVLGFSPVTHRATVSSITAAALPSPVARQLQERAVRGLRDGTFDIFQLDATAYPGNSGGPLFDPQSGEVMGVLNMVLIKGTRESALSQPSGIAYAIPIRHVRELMGRQP
ncbi:MAG: S1C family serine protease [Hydrogenophaga sp.]|uniref:S1C family serine protease n=1 Tax=Hydrogenophaga sp. TaxID=1904254 RepID=UPI003D9ADCC8